VAAGRLDDRAVVPSGWVGRGMGLDQLLGVLVGRGLALMLAFSLVRCRGRGCEFACRYE